jgi:acyl-coenzyme A thioesterase PaaI-like protein
MNSAADAVAFQKLDDTDGTGDITALGGIRLTGQHYRSAIDGTLVVIAEAEPLTGRSPLLDDAALTGTRLPEP